MKTAVAVPGVLLLLDTALKYKYIEMLSSIFVKNEIYIRWQVDLPKTRKRLMKSRSDERQGEIVAVVRRRGMAAAVSIEAHVMLFCSVIGGGVFRAYRFFRSA
uniref:Uncharacterized protein n=1 Tax=Romanomermis culicivorax TaxID=13658 RepID=A0A915L4Y4_ROMCU